ncbi:hypothetical protein AB3S75_043237 [Citrus x aurantiifolia]
MRPLFVLCTLSVLHLLASTIDARKDLEEYWRIVMKGQPMPESVQDLLTVHRAASTTDENAHQNSNLLILSDTVRPSEVESLAKNFNLRQNILGYFPKSHIDQLSEMNFNSRPNFLQHDSDNSHNNQPSDVKPFSKNFNLRPNILGYFPKSHIDQPSEMNFNSRPNFLQHDSDKS